MIDGATISKAFRALHASNRLGFGPRPGDLDAINRSGAERWIEQQLHPEKIAESPELDRQIASLSTLRMTPVELVENYGPPQGMVRKPDPEARKEARQEARIIVEQAVQARLYRAIAGTRRLKEVMTTFWFNHFNVFAGKGLCHLWVGSYEEQAIRPHTLGRFRDLLGATAKHPAMLFYLDNWQNTAPGSPGSRGKFGGINENYVRELMELHTLGVNGGYTQQDVIALAHILTGWGIVRRGNQARGDGFWRRRRPLDDAGEVRTTGGFFFDPSRHDFSDKILLGWRIPSAGISEGEEALDLLARHPSTARHLSYQLAQYFVADDPPPSLVERMSARYLASDGDIREVLGTMFTSAEFWDQRYYASKFKTPYEFVISAVRASGLQVTNVRPLAGTMAGLGMPLYGCQTPDGYKNTQTAWLNPEAMMTRLSFATGLGAGRLPLDRVPNDTSDSPGPLINGFRRISYGREGMPSARPDPTVVAATLGGVFSDRTASAVTSSPDGLRSSMILGSPDFMMR